MFDLVFQRQSSSSLGGLISRSVVDIMVSWAAATQTDEFVIIEKGIFIAGAQHFDPHCKSGVPLESHDSRSKNVFLLSGAMILNNVMSSTRAQPAPPQCFETQ